MSESPGDRKHDGRAGSGGGKGRPPRNLRGSPSRSRAGAGSGGPRQAPGAIGLRQLAPGVFELVHPRKVEEVREDYQEGIELWKEGDPESARDALRYALSACHENLWAHVALGRIALAEFRDPTLARGHFGYAVDLGERSLPQGFTGRLPCERPANRPFFEAVLGLIECLEALGRRADCERLSQMRERLFGHAH
jgi:hypothetical protein